MTKNNKMKTLTIEHLSAYLPYRVSVTRDGITIPMTADSNDIGANWISVGGLLRMNNVGRRQWQPLLRPLSQLTETIEHNGERFVPIVKLRNFENTNFSKYVDKDKIIAQLKDIEIGSTSGEDGGTYYVKFIEPYGNMEDGIIYFEYSSQFDRFGKIMQSPMRKPLGVGGQLQMFQMLHSWHFDTFGLIEAGLAMPIQSIPQP